MVKGLAKPGVAYAMNRNVSSLRFKSVDASPSRNPHYSEGGYSPMTGGFYNYSPPLVESGPRPPQANRMKACVEQCDTELVKTRKPFCTTANTVTTAKNEPLFGFAVTAVFAVVNRFLLMWPQL